MWLSLLGKLSTVAACQILYAETTYLSLSASSHRASSHSASSSARSSKIDIGGTCSAPRSDRARSGECVRMHVVQIFELCRKIPMHEDVGYRLV